MKVSVTKAHIHNFTHMPSYMAIFFKNSYY